MAEKKRRDAIREGYDNLADLGTIQNIFLRPDCILRINLVCFLLIHQK